MFLFYIYLVTWIKMYDYDMDDHCCVEHIVDYDPNNCYVEQMVDYDIDHCFVEYIVNYDPVDDT
jgi:hypothetical protein